MNKKEFEFLTQTIVELLKIATVDNFRADLTSVIDLTKVNLPKRKLFDAVSDVLTLSSVCSEVGEWVIAEVEGCSVQFNRLSVNSSPTLEV